jgi:hypothetical protein
VTDRSDRGVRYFPDVVEQIAALGRDTGTDERPGRVVVVSGTPQSGRSTVLRQAVDDLRGLGFRVVRRRAEGGALRAPDESAPAQYGVQGAKVGAALLQVAGVGLAGNLIALAAEIATTKLLADVLDPAHLPSDPYLAVSRVEEAVRWRAQDGPLALIVDDADKLDMPEVWWDVLFGTTLPRLADHLPLLVVLGVERASTAASYALEVLDKRLVPAARAEEIRLPPLDAARIEGALGPVDAALLRQLRPLVQGRPGWLDEVWRTWHAEGAVVRRAGRWVAAPDARDRVGLSLHAWVERLVRAGAPDGDAYWRAKEILETAALEGQRFTVEALAAVLNDDVEDVIDWIDDHLAAADGDSLLAEDGFVERAEGVEPPELRCYRFRSAMVAGVLRQEVLAGTKGKEQARRYAHALAGVYHWSPVSASAWTISRLATAAGDEELAETIWRRANRLEDVEAAARLAQFLIQHTDVRSATPPELAAVVERLNGLMRLVVGRSNAGRARDLAEATAQMAQVIPEAERVDVLVEALRNHGAAAIRADRRDNAIDILAEAATTSARADDPVRTADLYRMLANVEWAAAIDDEQRAAARRHISTAVEHARRGTGRRASTTLAYCLAETARSTDNPAQRVRLVGEAAGILLDTGGWRGGAGSSPLVIELLGHATELASDAGDRRTEERFLTFSLRCPSEAFVYVRNLADMSRFRRRLGDLHGAVRAAAQSLRLAQELSTSAEGQAHLGLAFCARVDGRPADAFALLAAARIGADDNKQIALIVEDLRQGFGDVLARLDDPSTAEIEHDYQADRGASLLRETFGVDVTEIDALNERLGDATEDELRGFLLDVQQYCARLGSTAAT